MAVLDQDNIIHGPATIAVDGNDLGFTQGGVTVRKSNDYLDVEADQVSGVIKKARTSEKMFVATTVLESILENMKIAFAEPATNSSAGQLIFGSADPEAIEHTLTLVGEAPSAGTRTYTFYRAILVEELEHVVGARDAIGALPVVFECLKDPDNAYGFGKFVDT